MEKPLWISVKYESCNNKCPVYKHALAGEVELAKELGATWIGESSCPSYKNDKKLYSNGVSL